MSGRLQNPFENRQGHVQSQGSSGSKTPPPSIFQPPQTRLRNTIRGQHEQSVSAHHSMDPTMRVNGSFKPSDSGNESRHAHIEGKVQARNQHGDFKKTFSSGSDLQLFSRKASFMSGEGGSFDPYQRKDDNRHPPDGSRTLVDRSLEARGSKEGRRSVGDGQYSYKREGPSPGRNFSARSDDFGPEDTVSQQYMSEEKAYSMKAYQQMSPFRTKSGKRKQRDPHAAPGGPRLISNQSSDDSINAFLPKRARQTSLSTESVNLMKSFTPLSPMNSRTFSRDEVIDMSRFTSSRRGSGSGEGYRILNSWSSGNSNHGSHSPSDVKLCYEDWQTGARRVNSRIWEDKMPMHLNAPRNQDKSSIPYPSHPGQQAYPVQKDSHHRWPSPPLRDHHPQQAFQDPRYESQNPRSKCQALHPEDRYVPYANDLHQHASSMPSFTGPRMTDGRRSMWRENPSSQFQYPHQRRDERDDRSKVAVHRGRPPSPRHIITSSTPPMNGGWGRNPNDFHQQPIYESQQMPKSFGSYENWRAGKSYTNPYGQYSNGGQNASKTSHLQGVKIETGADGTSIGMRTSDDVLLLSLPEDRISLSETLCIVRENVEVFVATEADVKAPAPGRKRPVVEGQVGLRCIHCRAALHQSEKVKRAVCFPSSIKRIYRTVIDMKLDHFKACRFVPIELKMKLEELKATNARSTGTTMQYFVQAAKRMGMVDGDHGIRYAERGSQAVHSNIAQTASEGSSIVSTVRTNSDISGNTSTRSVPKTANPGKVITPSRSNGSSSQSVPPGVSFNLSMDLSVGDNIQSKSVVKKEDKYFSGKTLLAIPEDKSALSPLRCFLRNNVYAFTATEEDIAVRTPTTFSVSLGQVGIGCIHCHKMRAKERTNRAVCFPFSINRIYQSVADIQRFHLGECKMVPNSVRAEFLALQSASSKGSKGLATRQYWVTSAKKLGLVDTDSGIRFIRDPTAPIEKAVSLDILAQVASDVTTAAKPLVLPEDEPLIAGFLYHVMKQLQPCRFTEADRNKRRLKDVGCIGVECKHCAGQVDGRKFFWSSVNAVESNFVSVHTHMMECKNITTDLREKLAHLKTMRKEETARLKSGSQKAFFSRVWNRLHAGGDKVPNQIQSKSQIGKSMPALPVSEEKIADIVLSPSSTSSPSGFLPSDFSGISPDIKSSPVTFPTSPSLSTNSGSEETSGLKGDLNTQKDQEEQPSYMI